jgi:MFS family permease
VKVGYYVGLMVSILLPPSRFPLILLQQSIFFATQALTVMYWSRISDYLGRKPIILIGLAGLSLSMFCFGLSKTFWSLVISRSINGALNGKPEFLSLIDVDRVVSSREHRSNQKHGGRACKL